MIHSSNLTNITKNNLFSEAKHKIFLNSNFWLWKIPRQKIILFIINLCYFLFLVCSTDHTASSCQQIWEKEKVWIEKEIQILTLFLIVCDKSNLPKMGGLFSYFKNLFGSREMRILILGLDGAGKTTLLYRLQVSESYWLHLKWLLTYSGDLNNH